MYVIFTHHNNPSHTAILYHQENMYALKLVMHVQLNNTLHFLKHHHLLALPKVEHIIQTQSAPLLFTSIVSHPSTILTIMIH